MKPNDKNAPWRRMEKTHNPGEIMAEMLSMQDFEDSTTDGSPRPIFTLELPHATFLWVVVGGEADSFRYEVSVGTHVHDWAMCIHRGRLPLEAFDVVKSVLEAKGIFKR